MKPSLRTIQQSVLAEAVVSSGQALSRAESWFTANKLYLNATKTRAMVFTTRKLPEMENPANVEFLGVYLDPGLRWNEHTD
ncbi:hypothetical protein JTB14_015499 [Gonioctena quinquepunctata]|nr:hypothetical protein JTB14_015499 [Gonioctena quinquepunctata]